jgi:hypothetical protein
MAESQFEPQRKLVDAITAGQTKNVDTLKLSLFNSLEYIINIYDAAGPRVKALKMRVDRVDVSVKDQVYARAGDPLNIQVNAVSNGVDFNLEFISGELVPVDVVAIRTIL